ncbi:MAG: DUF4157 domain-containing protein [Bacteroidia bacterium]|nr:DUF4157 domain-containing protein [Bacteroidia bacterium]
MEQIIQNEEREKSSNNELTQAKEEAGGMEKTMAPPVFDLVSAPVQQKGEEEEESLQMKGGEEEESLQMKGEEEEESLQMKGEEEEESLQMKGEEEEESLQMKGEEEEESLQMKGEEEEESLQMKSAEEEESVQKKEAPAPEVPVVAAVQKKGEEEEESLQMKSSEEEESVQKKDAGSLTPPEFSVEEGGMPLQRKSSEDKESVQKKEAFGSNLGAAQLKGTEEEESVQKKESGNGESFSPAAESGGSGGLGPVQQKMESAFNSDFSNVNVHENSQKASDIGALAYTQGNDVHFAPGQFKPDTQGGQELIGHELTHVVQQRENRVTPTTQTKSGMPVNDDKGLEGEADHMGAKAARGENTGMNGGASNAAGPEVQAKVASVPTFLPVADPIQQKSDGEEEETSQKKEAPFSKEVDMGDATPPADANSNPGQFKMAPFQLKAQAPVQKAAGDPPATESAAPTTVVQLANGFNPPADVAGYLNENHKKWVTINAAMGSIASGPLKVRQKTKPSEDGSTPGTYEIKSGQGLDLKMGISFLNPLAANGILPVIALNASDVNNITGFLSFRVGETVMPDPRALITQINQNLEMFGLMGVTPITVPDYQNEVVGGILTLMAPTLNTQVGGFMNATGNFGLVDGNFVFHIEADVTIDGLAHGLLMIERNEEGHFNGEADIDVTVQNLSGNVKVVYANGSVTGRGTANIQSEKFSGSLTMIYDEEAIANAAVHEGLGIETMSGGEGEGAPAPGGKKVIAGFGSVTVQLTDWLTATANVGVDSQGHVTIHGQLGFPDQVELMEQQDKKKDLFNVEIKAGYGIPLVGQVFLFASVGMFVKGGFGPLVLKDIIMEGTYSTDPNVLQNFKIGGTLAIGAYAALGLQVRAGVGLTLLGHDIKAGIDVDAMAGIQAYAEATPTFEYFEKDSDGQKVGEAHLKGHFEAAARLFLELAGAFFVEVDAPWWSPCPDKTWEWPFGSVTYPIGDSLGVGADVDWLVGSPDVPEVAFSPVEFDPDKFVSDMTKEPDDFGADGPGGDQEQQGEWTDAGGGENQLEGDPQAPTAEGGGQPQEDLSKLSSEEKYMRALGEIGEIAEGCNTKPVPDAVLRTRCNAIKSKYGINQVTLRNRQKDSIEIYVQHGSQNNRDNVIKCKVISEHERDLQFQKAVDDLNKMLEVFGAPETGAVTRSQITTAAKEVDIAHEVIVDTEVRDQGTDWVVFGDIEETKRKMTQKPKAEAAGMDDSDSVQNSPEGEFKAVKHMKEIAEHSKTSPYTHEEVDYLVKGLKGLYKFDKLSAVDNGDSVTLDEDMAENAERVGGESQNHAPVQRKENENGNTRSEESENDSKVSLPDPIQNKMENHFGTDFSTVQMYEGKNAGNLGAEAYTQGNEVHFDQGNFRPETQSGQELVAHELSHVVQQSQGRVGQTNELNGQPLNDNSGLEAEADKAAEGLSNTSENESPPHQLKANSGGPIQRMVKIHTTLPSYPERSTQEGITLTNADLENATKEVMKFIHDILVEMKGLNPGIDIPTEEAKLDKASVKSKLEELINAPISAEAPPASMGVVNPANRKLEDSEGNIPPTKTLNSHFEHLKKVNHVHLYQSTTPSPSNNNLPYKDLARRVIGEITATDNAEIEKRLANEAMASGWVKSTLKRALQRVYDWIMDTRITDGQRDALKEALKDFMAYKTSKYYPWYHEFLDNENGGALGMLKKPNQGQIEGNIALLHDVMDHSAAIAKGKVKAHSELVQALLTIDKVPSEAKKGTVSGHEEKVDLGDYRAQDTSVIEFNDWIASARANNMPLDSGPSMTTARMLELMNAVGGTPAMKKAVAWAIFGLWNTVYYRGTSGIHTFHEVMDIANNYCSTGYTPFNYPEHAP